MVSTQERNMVHVRLPKDLVKRVDRLRIEWETDRARAMERLLERAVAEAEREYEAVAR